MIDAGFIRGLGGYALTSVDCNVALELDRSIQTDRSLLLCLVSVPSCYAVCWIAAKPACKPAVFFSPVLFSSHDCMASGAFHQHIYCPAAFLRFPSAVVDVGMELYDLER